MKGAPSAPRRASEPSRRRRRREEAAALPPLPFTPPRKAGKSPLGALGYRVADSYLWMSAALSAELVVVGIARHHELASVAEISTAAVGLLPIGVALVGPLAIVFGAALEAVRAGAGPVARWLAASFVAACAGAVAYGVSTGRHLEGARRPLFVASVAGAFLIATRILLPLFAAWLDREKPGRRFAVVGAGCVLAIAISEVANLEILPRLYPAMHLGLDALALFAAAAITLAYELKATAVRAVAHPPRRWVRPFLAVALFAAMAAVAPRAAHRLALADNIRLIYSEHAPMLGEAVYLATRAVPPPPLDPLLEPLNDASAQTIDLTGYDILLVSIDALRADHLGAYGYDRPTTPNIDRLAKQGVLFEAAYTTTPHTSYAITSLMTGKYMRPLILQGLGDDSETWADHLKRYGYKTAAFYPPAVFFIDSQKFEHFHERAFGFEYRKEEFADPVLRASQVQEYLNSNKGTERRFLWVHFFEPHEPYENHSEHSFGDRDVDRYDSEIAAADVGVGQIVDRVLAERPKTLVIITADHGEEFGDHGGHYHGTTVYEEQVRVPLIVLGAGLLTPRRVEQPVQLIDLLPTVLRGLGIPRPARVRGRDIGPLLTGKAPPTEEGRAFAETDTMTMLAESAFRLVCMRRAGACTLYNARKDPAETRDLSGNHPEVVARMRSELAELEASHGKYELRGLRMENKSWPEVLRRGIAGDGDAAPDIVPLLDDADVNIRRKSAEVLFDLKRPEAAAGLKLALTRDEDPEVKAWAALGLTRLGEEAPLIYELLNGKDLAFRRLSALALGEGGDARGQDELIAWWRAAFPHNRLEQKPEPIDFERAKEILAALARLKPKTAIVPLVDSLPDVRLRPFVADTLAAIGDDAARVPLADQLLIERYQTARVSIAEALLKLGAGPELLVPLTSLLGMPDPLPNGLGMAMRADLLKNIGGPVRDAELRRMQHFATSGVAVDFFVPKLPVDRGVRILCRAKSSGNGEIRVGRRLGLPSGSEKKSPIPNEAPPLDPSRTLAMAVGSSDSVVEVFATLPQSFDVHPGKQVTLVFYATQGVSLDACALVPLRDELPPPPKEPWTRPEGDAVKDE